MEQENFKEIKILWDFSFPAFLAGLMDFAPVVWYANYVLVNQPSGYLQMANFDIASQMEKYHFIYSCGFIANSTSSFIFKSRRQGAIQNGL